MVDRSARKKWHMAGFAWAGACCASLLFFMQGENWQLGAVAIVLSSVLAGCSLVSYSAILCDISTEDERDRVSSRGWAFGYLGGGLLLLINLVVVLGNDAIGLEHGHGRADLAAVGGGVVGGVHDHPVRAAAQPSADQRGAPRRGALFQRSFGQLFTTLREMKRLPDDADLPRRLPLLQRRHPDRDLQRRRLRLRGAEVRPERADRARSC